MDGRPFISKHEVIHALKGAGLKPGDQIIAHTSLKKLGFVVGGAETILRAILEVLGPQGTIMMPAQTWKNLDPSRGVHWEEPEEWWPLLREQWPAFDKLVTPSIGMGVVAEMLRTWPGACRSDHPARSFSALGPNADYLTRDHDLSNIFGPKSPLDKLYSLGGKVVLLGVGYDKNTSLHLAETRAEFPGKKTSTESSAMTIKGLRQWVIYETQDVDDGDFVSLGEAYEAHAGIRAIPLGNGEVRVLDQVHLVDWATRWMEEHRR